MGRVGNMRQHTNLAGLLVLGLVLGNTGARGLQCYPRVGYDRNGHDLLPDSEHVPVSSTGECCQKCVSGCCEGCGDCDCSCCEVLSGVAGFVFWAVCRCCGLLDCVCD